MMNFRRLTLSVLFLGLPIAAASAAPPSEAQRWATETGQAAGQARFCKLDQDTIEKFETRAAARMAKVALDDIDIAVARVTYKNALAVAASHGPAEDCQLFAGRFDTLYKSLKPLGSEQEQPK